MSHPLRVLHISSGNLYGGIETLLHTMARERNLRPSLSHAFALCFEGRLARELRDAGVEVHVLGPAKTGRPWSVWRARSVLRELLRGGRYDVVICHAIWPQALFGPVVRTAGVPLAFFQHDALTGQHWLERWARVTPPDLVLTNSRFAAGTLVSVYPQVPWRVTHCPLPMPPPALGASERARLRTELGASEGDAVIFHASRMQEGKGQRLLLEALGRLRAVPGWCVWFAGGAQRPDEEAYQEGLRAQAKHLGIEGRLRLLGQRSDVPRLLRAADIHCQPNSRPEAFGLVFVEALQAGLPVVTTPMGGALEIVDASCGVFVRPEPESLALALGRLIEDPQTRARLGAAGPARAAALCDAGGFLRGMEEALRALSEQEVPV
ncbi:glycosyl transferase, group 1 family protein [Myxococcus xanthus DK 1622]|uniref:Glycosyl transferase, group 1 family protein n=1 Tax=Myxococcus xanthus (strain DK1622) TaxID=246197 RepID=Q1DDI5_MYXXD|nr:MULTISPECIES: glycosyltransferase family 4 protein [Myxococcus]ABF89766.1 glycosyl transferase, group 1 family protein [Myxococcus xanthus DK 1622]NOJ52173.1 glycosyltransferase family 4 protein [Myxococcus xanthus]QPM80681.1 glycosyltransferase family 4 protein [Myxococcus xanthus]QVW69742.1 glycosyltransferase family 4 protein [Myxococcus xanthus DZ2]QZZ48552.1 D-inositol-3-phosphate glycosyltransferase [Myxococcus xanthus]